ncbi:MAG: DUF983 domain-containing protein [Litorimonas sp.]
MTRRRPAPMEAGLSGRCPKCGEGRLFQRFLTFAPGCAACGADFASVEDTGDGPAVFVIFLVGIFIVPIPVLLSLALQWPSWLLLAIFGPLILGVSLWLLRLLRGVMFAQGWARHAREQRFRSGP